MKKISKSRLARSPLKPDVFYRVKHGAGPENHNKQCADNSHAPGKIKVFADFVGQATCLGESYPDAHHNHPQSQTEKQGHAQALGYLTGGDSSQQSGDGRRAGDDAAGDPQHKEFPGIFFCVPVVMLCIMCILCMVFMLFFHMLVTVMGVLMIAAVMHMVMLVRMMVLVNVLLLSV